MIIPMVATSSGDFRIDIAGGESLSLATVATNAGWAEDSDLFFVVTSDVTASGASNPAMTMDINTDLEVRIRVESGVTVTGAGGSGSTGSDGGDAILAEYACSIQNLGTIAGGGGGGASQYSNDGGGGGGGGAGTVAGLGGIGGSQDGSGPGDNGANGTATTGGAGGAGNGQTDGADGGDLGQPAPVDGGAAGSSISGYALVSYSGGGTLLGPTS